MVKITILLIIIAALETMNQLVLGIKEDSKLYILKWLNQLRKWFIDIGSMYPINIQRLGIKSWQLFLPLYLNYNTTK